MSPSTADRTLVRHGFLLFLIALVIGLAIPAFPFPKIALSAHVSTLLNGLFLIALGLAWPAIDLSPGAARLVRPLALYGTWANLALNLCVSLWGAGRLLPLASAGRTAQPWQDALTSFLAVSLGLAMVAALGLVVWRLWRTPPPSNSRALN